MDEGLLFGEFKAARLNRGARLGFEGFKVGADVFGVLIGTEKDRDGNTRTAGDASRHRAGGGFKMEVAVFESGIDAGIDRDAVGVLAPGGVTFHHLQGLGLESATYHEFGVGGEGGRHEDLSGKGAQAFPDPGGGLKTFGAEGSVGGNPCEVFLLGSGRASARSWMRWARSRAKGGVAA